MRTILTKGTVPFVNLEHSGTLNRIINVPRTTRHQETDTIYHVVSRGVERRMIFLNDSDKQYFLSLLIGALRESGCSLFAYCLMGNHFHLLVATGETPLGIPLHQALTTYALRFNAANNRTGHLFQGRFHSQPVQERSYLHAAIAYIHANPVRANLVTTVDEWTWSSHADWAAVSGNIVDFRRLERLAGTSIQTLRDEYLRRLAQMFTAGPHGLSLEALIVDTCRMMGLSSQDVISGRRGHAYTKAKRIMMERAQIEGFNLRQLALALNCSPSALSMTQKRQS